MACSRAFKCVRFINPTDLMQNSLEDFAATHAASTTASSANVRLNRPSSKFLNESCSVPMLAPMKPRQPPTAIDDRTPRITVT